MNASDRSAIADDLRAIEVQRLRDLVSFDMAASLARHADDFQLINPMGVVLTRDDYLGALQSGVLVYHLFEPVSEIVVRPYGDAAILRYQSHIDVEVEGHRAPRAPYWHTDCYERRDGAWQVVWSQATAIHS
ncbi:MAG: nuclear transport factor 2 family protein [Thermomicrobiales bacterium]